MASPFAEESYAALANPDKTSKPWQVALRSSIEGAHHLPSLAGECFGIYLPLGLQCIRALMLKEISNLVKRKVPVAAVGVDCLSTQSSQLLSNEQTSSQFPELLVSSGTLRAKIKVWCTVHMSHDLTHNWIV